MTCTQCKYITVCMAEADGLGQVFDPNYDGGHGCTDFVPFTNADRIRAMSDEELAEFIKNIKVRAALCKAVKNNDAFDELCSAEWLKQPAGEEDKHETL